MTLFQLLRIVDKNCPLKIVDINNAVLDSAYSKGALNINNFDYEVFKIDTNNVKNYVNEPNCIVITLIK